MEIGHVPHAIKDHSTPLQSAKPFLLQEFDDFDCLPSMVNVRTLDAVVICMTRD